MKVNYAGCAICDSTWGDLWAEVEGERLFFCCSICELQFRGLLARVRQATGWDRLDSVEIQGDRRGRTCRVRRGTATFRCFVAFTPSGAVRRFDRLPVA